MKILLIIDTQKYKYHNELYVDFESALVNYFDRHGDNSLIVFDMSVDDSEHEKFSYIKNLCADLIITLDCAGFDMLTTGNTLSYNNLPCRMAHVLTKNDSEFNRYLEYRQNFSMVTYYPEDENMGLRQGKYPWITNVQEMKKLVYKNISEKDHSENIAKIELWLSKMLKDLKYEDIDT